MKFFITGSTGYIGKELTKKIISQGCEINILVRSENRAKEFVHPKVTIFTGDITDAGAVEKAMKGCTHVFHIAALAKAGAAHNESFDKINVTGTQNVLNAAEVNGIKRLVFTSSAGVLWTSNDLEDVSETSDMPEMYYTDYARTKSMAEALCREYVEKGLDIVIVMPSRVYGPGLLSDSNGVTKIIKWYMDGKWRWIPGNGKTYGNYVYIEDVVNGHLLAMHEGRTGERYILGGENVTFKQFFDILKEVTGRHKLMVHLPYPLMWVVATFWTSLSFATGNVPVITPGWIKRYLQHRRLSVDKARDELGYKCTSFREGVLKTVEWLKTKN